MKVRFLTPATQEYLETIDYYNQERSGLGYEFAVEIDNAINRIIEHPKAWQALSRKIRRCCVNRFPYGIMYQIKEAEILVIAVMHFRKDPNSWKNRI